MNRILNIVFVSIFALLLTGCASFYGARDRDVGYVGSYQRPASYASAEPQTYGERSHMRSHRARRATITGEVTSAGGFIAQDGTTYRLNGAKAEQLRDYAGQTVTVEGRISGRGRNRAIMVQNFQTGESSRSARTSEHRTYSRRTQTNQPADYNAQSRDTDINNNQQGTNPDYNQQGTNNNYQQQPGSQTGR